MFDSLTGITLGKWLKLLSEYSFRVSRKYWIKSFLITFFSLRNSYLAFREERSYKSILENVEFEKEPIFIIGHWRSGTTFLHNILSQDPQFAFPNLFDIKYPHSIILHDHVFQKMVKNVKYQKRSMDNVSVSFLSPQEEEFAITILTLKSSMLNWIFPKN